MSLYATSKPIREQPPGTYTCQRCGIQPSRHHSRAPQTHCKDCKRYKEQES